MIAETATPDGTVAHSSQLLEQLIALAPRMSGSVEQVLQAGDTALVAYRWQLHATAPGRYADPSGRFQR